MSLLPQGRSKVYKDSCAHMLPMMLYLTEFMTQVDYNQIKIQTKYGMLYCLQDLTLWTFSINVSSKQVYDNSKCEFSTCKC